MAIAHLAAGTTIVSFNSNQLGYSEDGCQMQINPRYADVFSDQWGGRQGAPSDSQILGGTVLVSMLMTAYEAAEEKKMLTLDPGAAANGSVGASGEINLPTFGSFIRQDGIAKALLLTGTIETYTFTTAFLRQSIDVSPIGTVAKKLSLGFECWCDAASTRKLLQLAASA